jgi:DNA-directed RNA polymerase specialized sigma24 family protein
VTSRASDGVSDAIGRAWPSVERRLRASLAARGVDWALTDDIVQETALRALVNRVAFDTADDLYPWAVTVARNLHVSEMRLRARQTSPDALSDMPARDDVADAVLWGEVWTAAMGRLAQMPKEDRDALLTPLLDEPTVGGEPVRISVRRHRARARLRAALAGLLGWLVPPLTAALRPLRRHAISAVPGAAGALVAVALVMLFGAPPGQAGQPARPPSLPSWTRYVDEATTSGALAAHVAARRATIGAAPRLVYPPEEPLRHVHVDTPAGPGVNIQETRPPGPRPLLCLHGPVVDGTCAPPLPRHA